LKNAFLNWKHRATGLNSKAEHGTKKISDTDLEMKFQIGSDDESKQVNARFFGVSQLPGKTKKNGKEKSKGVFFTAPLQSTEAGNFENLPSMPP
jgi:hypothetical protein